MIVVLSLIALRTWTWTSRLMLIAKEISLITRLHLVFLFFRVTHLSLTWRSKKQSIIYLLHFWSWILHYGSGYYWNSLASMASIGLWAFLLSLPHFFIVIIRVSFRSPTTLFFMCTKNIEVDCHFVRQHLQSCTIDRLFVSFSLQLADFFLPRLTSLLAFVSSLANLQWSLQSHPEFEGARLSVVFEFSYH